MKRPMICIMIFFMAGIFSGRYMASALYIIILLTLSYLVCFALFKAFNRMNVFLLPLLILLGIFLTQKSIMPKSMYVDAIVGKNIEICGHVADYFGQTHSGKSKVIIKTTEFKHSYEIIKERIKIYAYIDGDVNIGQNVLLTGRLIELDGQRNPGGFDEFLYLRSKKVQYKIFPENVEKGEIDANLSVLLSRLKTSLNGIYDKILPEKEASVMKAMITGDKTELDEGIAELYINAGIYHILAISGLHISIIFSFLIFIVSKIDIRSGRYAILAFLTVYCIFTGASVSTVRAVIMCGVYLCGHIFRREPDFISSVCFSCFALLIYEPLYLWNVGFLYSFSSVFGIALLNYPISRLLNFNFFKDYVNTCLSVSVMNKGVQAFFFYNVNTIDIFVNILLLPFVSIIIMVGFLTGIIGFISIDTAMFLSGVTYFILNVFEVVCSFAVDIPFTNINIGRPGYFILIMYYIVVFAFAYMLYDKNNKSQKYFYGAAASFVLSAVILNYIPHDVEIAMLDVSQGDCIVTSHKDFNFIIDGGGNLNRELNTDTGINILYPYLRYKGMNKIDVIFVSHTHDDHVKGIIEILELVDVEKIVLPYKKFHEEIDNLLLAKASEKSIPVIYMKAGDTFDLNSFTYINCISPFEDMYTDMDKNNSSLVLRFVYKDISFLFTGDIEKEAEDVIVSRGSNLSAHVLKVPHHGSKTSSGDSFIDEVSPSVAIVSTGRGNVYGHPSSETIEKFENRNIKLLNTADNGAIILKTNGNEIKIFGSDNYRN